MVRKRLGLKIYKQCHVNLKYSYYLYIILLFRYNLLFFKISNRRSNPIQPKTCQKFGDTKNQPQTIGIIPRNQPA